ncbi:MAG: hypothetical protein E7583_03450 [Ruminococcaceae bacterium]|nr:hypothetical protein [Oscillospiraceae bacterium]
MTDIEMIIQRFADILFDNKTCDTKTCCKYYDSLCENADSTFSWNDIDYSGNKRANWQPSAHYTRLEKMITTFGRERFSDSEYMRKLCGAIAFWGKHDFKCPNWWYNDIGTPMSFGNIGLMLYGHTDKDTSDTLARLCGYGSMKVRPMELTDDNGRIHQWTGANLLWGCGNSVRHALLTNDDDLLLEASNIAANEITVGNFEGIQKDGSFFQHGRLLYSGGYGRSFALDVARMIYIFDGTKYQFPKEKLDIFLIHILDGLKNMQVCGSLDINCLGREYVRPGSTELKNLKTVLKLMKASKDLPRKTETEEFILESEGKTHRNITKYYDIAKYLCHHTDGLFIGAKFTKSGLRGSEICNDENVLGKNIAHGCTIFAMRDGKEYYDIAPFLDYSAIPGTTAFYENNKELFSNNEWSADRYPNDYCDGNAQNDKAVVYQHYEHDGIDALVTCFAFKGGFVSMGCNITRKDDTCRELYTTLDQCFDRGDIAVSDSRVTHNGITYTSLDGKKITVKKENVCGKWTRNNRQFPDNSEKHSDILTLKIFHENVAKSSYAYMISREENIPSVKLLRNDSNVQAIQLPNGKVLAMFHNEGELDTDTRIIKGSGIYIE